MYGLSVQCYYTVHNCKTSDVNILSARGHKNCEALRNNIHRSGYSILPVRKIGSAPEFRVIIASLDAELDLEIDNLLPH